MRNRIWLFAFLFVLFGLIGWATEASAYTLRGRLTYYDKPDEGSKSVKATRVELYDWDEGLIVNPWDEGINPQLLGTSKLEDGYFEFTFDESGYSANEEEGRPDPDLYIKVIEEQDKNPWETRAVKVVNYIREPLPNYRSKIVWNWPLGTAGAGWIDWVILSNESADAFEKNEEYAYPAAHILTWMGKEYRFFKEKGLNRPQVLVLFYLGGSGANAEDGNEIKINGKSAWTAHVNIHEYAHTIMFHLYGDYPPGSKSGPVPHFVYSEANRGFAICEGWAGYMSLWLAPDDPWRNEIENNDWWKGGEADIVVTDGIPKWVRIPETVNDTNHSGQIVEGAVATIWYEQSGGFDDVWSIMTGRKPVKFKEFWTDYMEELYPGYENWQKRQAFRALCEKNGIVYSRVKITGTNKGEFPPGGNEILEFNERLDTKPLKLKIAALTADELHIASGELDPITSIRLQSKKTETLENDDDFLNPENWVNIGRWYPSLGEEKEITLDPRKLPLGRDKIHLRVRATSAKENSNNTTYDTFYPDYGAPGILGSQQDKKTIERLKELKVLCTDIKTKPARLTILDNSHSIGEGVAKNVAEKAVEDASFKAVVRFHNGAWATVNGIFALDHALELINGIKPAILTGKHGKGNTNIKAGFERGYEVLMRQKERAVARGYDPPGKFYWSINTDWKAKEGNNYDPARDKLCYEFKGGGDPIISPDAQIAAEIIEQAGGAYYFSTSPEEVTINHEMISREQAIDTFALNKKYTFSWWGNFNEEISLDASVSKALFVAKGTEGTTYLTLRRPDGSTVRSYNRGVEFYETTLNKMYIITNPQAGIWKISGRGRGTVRLKVGIETGINLELLTKLKSSGIQEKLIKVRLTADSQTIANSTLKVELSKRQEDDTTVPVETKELYDDGTHEDDVAGDGVFANTFTLEEGFYPFKVVASGTTAQGESYTRTLQHTLINKDMAPIITNSQPEGRFAIGDLSISAFISDDNDLEASMIEVKLDGKRVRFTYDENISLKELGEEGGQLEEGEEFWNPESEDYDIAKISYTPKRPFSEDEHTVEIIIKNKAGQVALESSWTFIVDLPTIADTILINEVHPKEKWVELKSLKKPIDISKYILWDMEGKDTPLAEEKVTLKRGEFAIIHWEKHGIDETNKVGDLNGNGYIDLYSEDPVPFGRDDQMVLLDGKGVIKDALVWANYDGEMKPVQAENGNKLVKYGEWKGKFTETNESAGVLLGVSNQSIGRKPLSADTNTKEEWTIQIRPTPGEENVTSTDPPAKGTIIINEVNPAADKGDWAELYCLSGPIDIAIMALGHMGGKIEPLASSPITLNSGDYVLVHWREGVSETDEVGDVNGNGIRDIYISSGSLVTTDDQLILRVGALIHDAVIWSNMDGKMTQGKAKQANKLVEFGEWGGKFSENDQSDAVEIGTPLQSLGRIPNVTDSNTKNDWKALLIPSPGRPNQEIIPPAKGSLIINEVYSEDDKTSSWAEIYCVNGPANLQGLVLTDKDGKDTTIVDTHATLGTGEYAVIHWEEGEDETDEKGDLNGNGYRDLYLSDYSPTGTDDQLVLTVEDIIYDAVIWTNNDGKIAKHEVKDSNQICEAKEWKGSFSQTDESKAAPHLGWYYHSIGRFPNLQDTNAKKDWCLMSPTPGKENSAEDHTPPTTILTSTPSHWLYKNEEGVSLATSNHTFALSAIDFGSGVDYIMVNVDNLGFLVYSEPISFTTEGEHTIQYGAVDKAGNEEEIKTFRVMIENTPPVLTLSVEPDLISTGEVSIKVTSDELLGPKPTVVVKDSASQEIATEFQEKIERTFYTYLTTVTKEAASGIATVEVTGYNLFGNMTTVTGSFTIDNLPPEKVKDLAATTGTTGGTVDLTWTAPGDDISELASYIVKYNTKPIVDEISWIQTTPQDFESGKQSNVDILSSPGDIKLTTGKECKLDVHTIALWHMNEGSGNIIYDASPHHNDGIIHGGANWIEGRFGEGLNLDGIDDYVEVAHSSSLNLNTPISIEAWVKPYQIDVAGVLALKGRWEAQPPAENYSLYLWNTPPDQNSVWLEFYDPVKGWVWAGKGNVIQKEQWNYIVGTYDGSTMKVYLNGTLIDSKPESTQLTPNSYSLIMGYADDWNKYLNGVIDEFRISNIARTAEEIMANYMGGYSSSGSFISSAYDTSFPSNFESISWVADTPSSTVIKFQIRTADTETGLNSATWYGPTSAQDYYTTSGAIINSVHDGDRWVQYKAFLETTDTTVSPVLHGVTIAVTREINWDTSIEVSEGVPVPGPAGSEEKMTVTGLTPGTLYYFALKSKDKVGNLSAISNSPSAEAQFGDVTSPEVTITSPEPKEYYHAIEGEPTIVNIVYTAEDPEVEGYASGIKKVTVLFNGEEYQEKTLDLSKLLGENILTIKAEDNAGNEGEAAVEFTVVLAAKITIKPEVLRVTPGVLTAFVEFPEGYDVASIIDATCDGAPSEKMMFSQEGEPSEEISGPVMIIKFRRDRIEEALSKLDPPQSIDTHFIVKGHFKHDADIFIFKGEDSIEKIIEDTTPPRISIRSPKKNQTIQGIVSVMGTVKDDSLKEYEVKYGAGYNPTSWTTIITSTLSVTNNTLATWDVTKLDGVYTLKVTASDNSGNENEASMAVTIDNTVVLLGPLVTPKVPAKPVTPTVPTTSTTPTATPTTPTEEVTPITPTTPTPPTTPEEEPEEEEEIGLSGTITPIPKE